MDVRTVKGLVHAALTVAALAEYKESRSKPRTLLLGLAAGWHLQAALYHFIFEEEECLQTFCSRVGCQLRACSSPCASGQKTKRTE